ncbi:ATPase [Rhodobacteraceae bacterium XHP0102]|nr:ATPase [Rhodobacteraceae bacterium XHP0102]
MSEWKARRFWTSATVEQHMDGFTVHLDSRPIRTPLKAPLVVPSHAMAEAIAAEWMAQEAEVKPLTMPVTRSANAAIDKVSAQKDEVVAMLAAYAETDLLCHRAEHPQELVNRQEQGWRPILQWIEQQLGASLVVTTGVLPVPQPAESLAIVHRHISQFDVFALTALHDLIALSGSAVLGLAVIEGQLSPSEAWTLSRIDEDFQAELWGEDEEAMNVAQKKWDAFLHAARFHDLLRL